MVPDSFIVAETGDLVFTRALKEIRVEQGPGRIVGLSFFDEEIYILWECKDCEEARRFQEVLTIGLAREGFFHIPHAKEAIKKSEEVQAKMGRRGRP